jgi:hypothetical protein
MGIPTPTWADYRVRRATEEICLVTLLWVRSQSAAEWNRTTRDCHQLQTESLTDAVSALGATPKRISHSRLIAQHRLRGSFCNRLPAQSLLRRPRTPTTTTSPATSFQGRIFLKGSTSVGTTTRFRTTLSIAAMRRRWTSIPVATEEAAGITTPWLPTRSTKPVPEFC